ncbi:Farnesyl-diphosphate farnesyltransferase [Sporisorium reilianum SRZ2]|uniref:Squalene synthase n=1 Tax=Sporisorium reilianum (strain SRZ2) TaxID=999809 RepID=E6ZPN4_SPORE|nr:Farnesyl-diphosphate farnesyltransferase [Sporisorium reilianum SRZ2]
MGLLSYLVLGVTHPTELRAMIGYKLWRDPLNDIKANPDASGWNREQMRDCWGFLDLTSRSFAAVIKELKGELSRVICLFYLVLRALDTVEDDMTIPAERKVPLLVNFYKYLEQPGWNFNESGPNEKDRQLLVEFDKVIAEYQLLDQGYKTVISDITAKMGAGMASYIELSAKQPLSVSTWKHFDLYCHFVAGLVGEGLSRLFSESKLERPWLGHQLELSNHMGLFLQKTNIIRDYAEDCDEGRFFWPKQCWGDDYAKFSSQPDVASGIVETAPGSNKFKPADGELGQRSMYVLSSMLLDAMSHATHALDYLALLKEQSVFNFCAIPQVMAIATLELMFANPDVFKKNVKIRKGVAVQLILKAVNPRDVAYTFLAYSRKIHKRLSPADPNFARWAVELARIEQWCETYYPSFIAAATEGREPDVRAAALRTWSEARRTRAVMLSHAKANGQDPAEADATLALQAASASALDPRDLMTEDERKAADKRDRDEMVKFFFMMLLGMTAFMGVVAVITFEIVWRFTMDGEPDPLVAGAVRWWNLLRVHGWHTVQEVLATVRFSVEHVWKHGVGTAAKVEL